MASNQLPDGNDDLFTLGEDMADGCHAQEAKAKKQTTPNQKNKTMKIITTIITAILLSACVSQAAIDGFVKTSLFQGSGNNQTYTVPTGKILVLQQVVFFPGTSAANCFMVINGATVTFSGATNGIFVLPKALYLPAGTTIYGNSAGNGVTFFGVIIDTADASLFVGGGSSLGNVAIVNNTMTGELQLSGTATSKVIIQSSTDLVNWSYDSTVVVQRSTDKTKLRFTVPVAGAGHYYRALVRRTNVG